MHLRDASVDASVYASQRCIYSTVDALCNLQSAKIKHFMHVTLDRKPNARSILPVTKHFLFIVSSQFFTHPVIDNLNNDKWYGELGEMWTPSYLSIGRWKWMFLDLWCLFDLVLFPIVFIVLYLIHLGRAKWSNSTGNFWTPDFKLL